MTDDSEPERDGFFGVCDLAIGFRTSLGRRREACPEHRRGALDAPRIEALRGRSFEFYFRDVQAGRAGPAFGRQPPRDDLRPALIENSKVGVREVTLVCTLDPALQPAFIPNDDGL